MTTEEIKEEMIELETIQIALNDKFHRIGEILNNTQKRIDTLKKEILRQASQNP